MKRIAINGFGSTGRASLKVITDINALKFAAIDDMPPCRRPFD